MSQPYSSNQKSQNAKFIIVTTLVTLVILGIAVWGIVFVANYQNRGNNVAYTDTPSASNQAEASSSENTEPGSTEDTSVAPEGSAEQAPDNNTENTENPEQPENSTEENSASAESEKPATSSCPPSCNTSQNNQNNQNDQNVENNQAKPAGTNRDNAQTSSVPNTGPEEILPVALLIGIFVAFLTSQNLVKRDIM